MIDTKILKAISEKSPLLAETPADLYFYSNRQNKAELQQGFPPPGIHKFLNKPEEFRSLPTYPKDFSYYINDIGFRDQYPDPSTKRIMAFFGCSCTFGEGLPTEDLFVTHVSNYFNLPSCNFGMPGASASRIALIFAAAARIWNIDTAVITLPSWSRFLYVSSENFMYNVLPANKTEPKEAEDVRNALVKNFSNQYLMFAFKDAICYIVATAKEKNIRLYLGTWDGESAEIIQACTKYRPENFELNLVAETARDKVHPGPNSSRKYANQLISRIKKNDHVKTR